MLQYMFRERILFAEGYRKMKLKAVSGMMLTLLLIGALTLAFAVQSVAAVDWWPMFHHDLSHTGYSTSTAPNTNNTIWNFTTGDWVHSSPAVVDGKVYVGSFDGKVYCLDALTGAHIWNYTTGDRVWSSPAVADGKVYVGSSDDKVYCLDASTGAFIWRYTTGGDVRSSPAVAYGNVYVGSWDSKVYCLDASTGAHIWNYTTGDWVRSSPAVADGKVFVGSLDSKVYCLDASTGALIWSYTTGGRVWSSVANGKVYVGSWDFKVYCLNGSTGAHIWNCTTGDRVWSSPAVAYGKVYVGSSDEKVYCLDASTGAFIWSYTTGDDVRSSPAVADGKVFVGSSDSKVYCLDASTGTLIWSYTTGGDVWPSPAVADGKVYVGSYDGKVYAFGARPPLEHTLTIDSSPTGVTFTVAGESCSTPWSGTYVEGTEVSLVTPETHVVGEARYDWDQWNDGNTSRSRTVIMTTDITLAAQYTGPYRQLTVTSSPVTGITFTIDGVPQTTPYTELLPEGSYTLEMPETYNGYVWSRWLEDGDTNRIKTITLPGTTWTAVYTPAPPPVGGKATPISMLTSKPELQIPWTWLFITILSLVAAVVSGKLKKKK